MGGRLSWRLVGVVVASALAMVGCRASGSTLAGSAPTASPTASAQKSIPVAPVMAGRAGVPGRKHPLSHSPQQAIEAPSWSLLPPPETEALD
jgi:hypothetical protein